MVEYADVNDDGEDETLFKMKKRMLKVLIGTEIGSTNLITLAKKQG